MSIAEAQRGQVIVRQGEPGHHLLIVIQGSVAMHQRNAEGSLAEDDIGVCKRVMGIGDSFGELAFVQGRPYAATVIARTDTKMIRMDRQLLSPLVEGRLHKFVETPRIEVVEAVFEKEIDDRNDNDVMILVNYCENNPFFRCLSFPVIEYITHVLRRVTYSAGTMIPPKLTYFQPTPADILSTYTILSSSVQLSLSVLHLSPFPLHHSSPLMYPRISNPTSTQTGEIVREAVIANDRLELLRVPSGTSSSPPKKMEIVQEKDSRSTAAVAPVSTFLTGVASVGDSAPLEGVQQEVVSAKEVVEMPAAPVPIVSDVTVYVVNRGSLVTRPLDPNASISVSSSKIGANYTSSISSGDRGTRGVRDVHEEYQYYNFLSIMRSRLQMNTSDLTFTSVAVFGRRCVAVDSEGYLVYMSVVPPPVDPDKPLAAPSPPTEVCCIDDILRVNRIRHHPRFGFLLELQLPTEYVYLSTELWSEGEELYDLLLDWQPLAAEHAPPEEARYVPLTPPSVCVSVIAGLHGLSPATP